METVLSAFFGSIGIWPNHHVTPAMERKAQEVLEFFEVAPYLDWQGQKEADRKEFPIESRVPFSGQRRLL